MDCKGRTSGTAPAPFFTRHPPKSTFSSTASSKNSSKLFSMVKTSFQKLVQVIFYGENIIPILLYKKRKMLFFGFFGFKDYIFNVSVLGGVAKLKYGQDYIR